MLSMVALDGETVESRKWAIDELCYQAYGVRPNGTDREWTPIRDSLMDDYEAGRLPPLPTCEDCGKKCGPEWLEHGSFTDAGPRCVACDETLPCEHTTLNGRCGRCGETFVTEVCNHEVGMNT